MIIFEDSCFAKSAKVVLPDGIDQDDAVKTLKEKHDMLYAKSWDEPRIREKLASLGIFKRES